MKTESISRRHTRRAAAGGGVRAGAPAVRDTSDTNPHAQPPHALSHPALRCDWPARLRHRFVQLPSAATRPLASPCFPPRRILGARRARSSAWRCWRRACAHGRRPTPATSMRLAPMPPFTPPRGMLRGAAKIMSSVRAAGAGAAARHTRSAPRAACCLPPVHNPLRLPAVPTTRRRPRHHEQCAACNFADGRERVRAMGCRDCAGGRHRRGKFYRWDRLHRGLLLPRQPRLRRLLRRQPPLRRRYYKQPPAHGHSHRRRQCRHASGGWPGHQQ